jgi:carbon-monoxide dehydrogenase small subunit
LIPLLYAHRSFAMLRLAFSTIYGLRGRLHSRRIMYLAVRRSIVGAKGAAPSTYRGRQASMSDVSLTVNGRKVGATVEDRTLLVQFLRENLGLTGTHVGCDTSQCGACVVHVDGKAVKSCTILAAQASGSTVVTIEGLADGADLHPIQVAFKENHGLQCGFCTPGMIMSAADMINRHPEGLDEATVRAELEGNICRCTGYHNIVKAILAASQAMAGGNASKAA